MKKYFKPLLVAGAFIASYFLFIKKAYAKTPNLQPFEGQLFTFSKEFDAAVMSMAKRLMPHLKPQDAFNIIMFNFWCESGIHAQAHVNPNPDKKSGFDFGLHDRASINSKTHGGGLFGLIRKYADSYIPKGMVFEDWLQLDEMEQLKAAEKWLAPKAKYIKEPQDIRMVGFAPAKLGMDDDTALYIEGGKAYKAHKNLDTNFDGIITLGEFEKISIDKWNKYVTKSKEKGSPLRSPYGAKSE